MQTRFHTTYRRSLKRGFTLMEMILVLAIIAVLVGMGIFAMVGVLDDANAGKAKGDIKTLEINLVRYKTNMGVFPSSLEDMVRRPGNVKGAWRPLMQESALRDAWGEPYQYRNPGKRNATGYDIYSKGVDKQDGTEDDIGNW